MDTLTHALMGAAIAQLGPARRVGNRALGAGVLIALIPDIDVPVGHWLGDAAALTFHRGITHSILFTLALAPLIGLLLQRWWRKDGISWRNCTLFSAAVLFSHLLLDSFTSYGIQLLLPFSDHSFAIASISVIDPLYTLPLLLALLAIPWLTLLNPWRTRLVWLALVVSSSYLAMTLHNKQRATEQLRAGLAQEQVDYRRLFVKPTMFNNLLWRGIAESDAGYYVGFHSLQDPDLPSDFRYFDRNGELLLPHLHEAVVQDLLKVSDGYYQVEERAGELYFYDLRYGQAFEWLRDDRPHVFTYRLIPGNGEPMDIETISLSRDPDGDRATFKALVERARSGPDVPRP